jgi:hypothetical protein
MDGGLVGQSAKAGTRRASGRSTALSALGPLTALAGLVWALIQPYRVTLFDTDGWDLWHLIVQPPLLVILAGAAFRFLVVPGLLADLEEEEETG